MKKWNTIIGIGSIGLLSACAQTVKLEAPEKPIVVNLNLDVKLKVEKDVEKTIKKRPDIF